MGSKKTSERHSKKFSPNFYLFLGAKVIAINPPSLGSRFTPGIQFVISGSNYDDIYSWANIILDKSSSLRIRNSDIDYKITNPRLNLNVDRDKAYELGVTAEEIGTTIETLFQIKLQLFLKTD